MKYSQRQEGCTIWYIPIPEDCTEARQLFSDKEYRELIKREFARYGENLNEECITHIADEQMRKLTFQMLKE